MRTAPFPSDWNRALAPFRLPCTVRSAWQLYSTAAAILSLATLAYVLLQVHWTWTIPLTLVLSGCLVRMFVLHHDCGHGSFFRTQRANDVAGTIIGWFVLTPYRAWRRQHAIHHATSGDLTRRGTGDIWTMTTREYEDAGRWRRALYRLARSPFVMCFGGGAFIFMVMYRIPSSKVWGYELDPADVRDIILTDVMAALVWIGVYAISPGLLLLVYLPALLIGAAAGVFLFYVQHQFEDAYWNEHDDWTFEHSAVDGSSQLQLHGVLRWMTASIGVHHIHHLAPLIPNYKLAECASAVPELSARVTHLTLWDALRTLRLKLYDRDRRDLITFAEHRRRRAHSA